MKFSVIKILCLFFTIISILCSCSKSNINEETELDTNDFVFQCLEKKTITSRDFNSGSNSETKYEVSVIGYCKKDIKEYRISIRYLDKNGRIITEDYIEAKKDQQIEAEKELVFSNTFDSEYIASSIKDVKITFWGIEYIEENSKKSTIDWEAIACYAVIVLITIGFVAFFVWIGKDIQAYEEASKEAQKRSDQKEEKQEDKEPEEDPKEEIKAESVYIACSKCGSKNKPLNQYCFYCGTSLKLAFQADENPTKTDSQFEQLKNENKRLRTELVTKKDEIRILESKLRIAGVLNNSTENEELKELLDENRELYKKLDAYTANEDYRKRYPAQYLSESGHWVRSKSEREIANFLFQHRIRFVFEKEYTYSSKSYPYYPDFYLPDYHLFIEYFGRYEDPKYDEKTKRKLEIYSQDRENHFEYITFENDNRLNDRLEEICRKYNIPIA